jgi:hypothetical protein
VGLAPAAGSPPLGALSLEAGFSFSPAEAPPEGLASLEAAPLEGASLLVLAVLSPLEEEDVSLGVLVVLVDVVEVEVFCAAAASALVFVGGVMSGVLLGTASETLLPPHAPSVSPHSSATHTASMARVFTGVPCACRTWGSR